MIHRPIRKEKDFFFLSFLKATFIIWRLWDKK